MKIKTIKHELRSTIKKWLESITDEEVRQIAAENVIVTGGSIASMLQGEVVNDYDLYFKTKEAVLAITNYYAKSWITTSLYGDSPIVLLDGERKDAYMQLIREDGYSSIHVAVENLTEDRVMLFFNSKAGYEVKQKEMVSPQGEKLLFPREPYSPLFFSPNAITLTNQIQLIIRFHGDAAKIHKNFDFVHATSYYSYSNNNLHTPVAALRSLITRELRYKGSMYPLTSIIRIKKFLARGYTINAGEMFKIMFQLSLLDLTNIAVLSDQLAGVDVMYFELLISAMLNEKDKNSKWKPDAEWISKTVEYVFNTVEHDED